LVQSPLQIGGVVDEVFDACEEVAAGRADAVKAAGKVFGTDGRAAQGLEGLDFGVGLPASSGASLEYSCMSCSRLMIVDST
jgi:hypothetical protein